VPSLGIGLPVIPVRVAGTQVNSDSTRSVRLWGMLRPLNDFNGYGILATDGPIGQVVDALVDDRRWAIRYLVVDTGTWLSGRRVLISPFSLGQPDWAAQQLPVTLTKQRVEDSPGIDTDTTISRQDERDHAGYYGHPLYWEGTGLWGMQAQPALVFETGEPLPAALRVPTTDAHLRSTNALEGHQILATDGDLGHVTDVLVEDQTWAVRYFVISTSNWWGGHKVLISPQWVSEVNWPDSTVSLDLSREQIKNAPPYDEKALFERQYEQAMHEHYGRPTYWAEEP
jgi:hypothetical protein